MRKLVFLGLFALSLSFFSNPLFAGDVSDCDILRLDEPGNDQYAPNMYGLCVAWHNANENGRDEIADRFERRAGFPVPGSPGSGEQDSQEVLFECPCWSSVAYSDICQLGAPSGNSRVTADFGFLRFNDSITFEFDTFQNFASDTYENQCAHTVQDAADGRLILGSYDTTLTEAEAGECVFELQLMATMHEDEIFCP